VTHMNVGKLKELLKGLPDDVTVKARCWYDEPDLWDGNLESHEYDSHDRVLYLDSKEPD
jgi:hypothetical protein